MTFMTELATNATSRGVGIVMYSGNNDALIPHLSTESWYLYFAQHEN
jgi:carboxypeptidase D